VAAQADWLERDLYAVLGVAEDADKKTISRAYRKLARQLHPDTHPDDVEATERFKGVTAAYDVLGDENKRAEYDEFRRAVAGAGRSDLGGRQTWGPSDGGYFAGDDDGAWTTFDSSGWTSFDPGSLDDLLSSVVGRGGRGRATAWRGDDLEAVLDLSFEDAVRGLTTEVTLSRPDGSQTFKVRVPAGVDDGQRIRLSGKGGPGVNGGAPGDLYAVVRVAAHPVFGRNGLDLTVEAPISWPEAVLGTEIDVPTLSGSPVRVRVPAGTPHGRTLRVRGRGVGTVKATGDLLVGIRVTVPDQISAEQRQAVQAVAEAFRVA
jgi:molecular chaperone DnaJ